MIEKGFYYHYKHNPEIINDYAYEVLGVSLDTEDNTLSVIYRPLYENTFLKNADFFSRPLKMFLEDVTVEGKIIPRFQKISDPDILDQLKKLNEQGI